MKMWFESVAVAQRRARRVLPRPVYDALVAGSERGTTMHDNVAAFAELGWLPVVVDQPAVREMATSVMGQPLSMPVLISPTGVQAVHPDGEVAVARAAANRGIAMGLSSFASKPVEEVVAANPQTFFQVYWCGTKDHMAARLKHAHKAGCAGLIVTLDWSFSHGRDWGSPHIPEVLDLKAKARFAPEIARRPRYIKEWVQSGGIPDLKVPNMVLPGEEAPTFFQAYGEWMQTTPPSWDDIRWLVAEWDGPVMIKGIMRVDDAKRAVDAGVAAISVSNHGGNNLDSTPSPLRALPVLAEAVGRDIDVVMDSGIRRGSDVVKAVALGAKAVMIGRAYLWGLAANGQAGVENVLDLLRNGIDATMLGLGVGAVADLRPEHVLVPDGFTRRLGDPSSP
jgi:heme/flavin dehydrogenase (mycofactocin system)